MLQSELSQKCKGTAELDWIILPVWPEVILYLRLSSTGTCHHSLTPGYSNISAASTEYLPQILSPLALNAMLKFENIILQSLTGSMYEVPQGQSLRSR